MTDARSNESAAVDTPFVWWKIEPRAALGLLAVFVSVALAQGLAWYASRRASGEQGALAEMLVGQLTGAITAWLALPMVRAAVHFAPDGTKGWWRFAATHVAGFVAFTSVHTSTELMLDASIASWLGRPFDVARLWSGATYEVNADLVLYPALAGLWYAVRSQAERARDAARRAKLERALAETRLDALAARLDPHFLFNTLNTISASMYEDLAKTETLLADLGALLRETLETRGPTWSFSEEREHASRYVQVLRARFEDRLAISWNVEAGLGAVEVPRFGVQSLVENAVKHNAESGGALSIEVVATRAGRGRVEIHVRDDGRGFDTTKPASHRRGLARLEETLSLTFGGTARLRIGASPSGGADVSMELPSEQSA